MTNIISPVVEVIVKKLTLKKALQQQSSRLFHGRGKMYDGLHWCSVDYFHPAIIVVVYQEPPVSWEAQLKDALLNILNDLNAQLTSQGKSSVDTMLIQRRYLDRAPFEALYGEIPETLFARRGENRFILSFSQQNVGYFLDIEPARQWLENHVSGANVLNLFSYTCAFSVVAKSAGARQIINMDLSRKSLAIGQKNHQINQLETKDIKFFPHDIFSSWGKLKKYGPYDVVIIDPPSFQKGSFIATKDYAKVIRKMPDLVASSGYFLACLNAPEIRLEEFKALVDENCTDVFCCEQILSPHEDFPEADEGRSLKMLVYKKVIEG